MLCKKIKLTVSARDAATLEFMQGKCRGLYNWWVMKLRAGERWPGWRKAKATLQESKRYDPELHFVYGKLLHEVYFRLHAAMQAFFRRVQNGEKPGFPRVRPRHCFFTLIYPAMYLKIEGKTLILPTGGKGEKHKLYPNVRARLTEEPPPGFRNVAISRDARGNYHASFVYVYRDEEHEEQPDEQAEQNERNEQSTQVSGKIKEPEQTPSGESATGAQVVAFDLGIKTLATGVNEHGRVYHIGGFKGHRWYNKQLDKIRSKRDKCKKKSRRYIRLSKVYRRVSEKKRHKQKDSLHKASHLITHKLVERTVVVGDLSQRQMVMAEHQKRNKTLNRMVYNDWGLYGFVQMLRYKCLKAGKALVVLDERDTSKRCSGCGHKQSMPLWKRTYRCENCGLIRDRDENSAVNILMRFLARPGPHMERISMRCADVFTATEYV
ncbi:MAG: IS200/IS605 family element transposase accessory protein TnpB [Ktedonobacteraceae bacterium]|nr:IS200/IS605 family element transposase accessory protein TnpB [Ktedonobacteraceae bacterium]